MKRKKRRRKIKIEAGGQPDSVSTKIDVVNELLNVISTVQFGSFVCMIGNKDCDR